MIVDSIESPLFRSSDQLRRCIFLVGARHCGKPTIVCRVLKKLTDNTILAGFSTFFQDNLAAVRRFFGRFG